MKWVVIRLGDSDLYSYEYESRQEALEYIESISDKCYLIGPVPEDTVIEPHT